MLFRSSAKAAGFTLIELIVVIAVVGILSAYAYMKNSSAAVYTVLSQSRTMASDIRHAQALATVWGRSLQVSATTGVNGTYSVSCVTPGASPCDANPVIDPATGAAFTVSLQRDVILGAAPTSFSFNSIGQPSGAAIFTLTAAGETVTLDIAALTGNVSMTP